MHRAIRVGEYWNWLPAFRAVAETASLRDAAKRVHVAPSAISRTIRLLEDSLGYPLFDRSGGTLSLNARGGELLDAVRAAMRMVSDVHGGRQGHDGPCHIHCPLDVAPLLGGALEKWARDHPDSPPLLHGPCAEDVGAQLLRGDLDVAIAFEHASQSGLTSTMLGELSSSIYCSPSHEAASLERLTEEHLATLPFIDYPVGELGFLRVMRDRDDQRVAYVPTMALALDMCARGLGLVCIPDFVARRGKAKVVRLPWELPLARLFAWYRRPLRGGKPAIVELLTSLPELASLVSE